MPVLLKMNLDCNFDCKYCYEHPVKPKADVPIDYESVDKEIKKYTRENSQQTICLHGGEPTIMSKQDIEKYLKMAFKQSDKSSIQTNGYAIDDDLIEMFKKYKTHVGFSLDGPWPLSEFRGSGSKKNRKKQIKRSFDNFERCRKEGIGVSIIAVLHRANTQGERLDMLKAWVKELGTKGVSGRLNPCCSGDLTYDLTEEELIEVYDDLADWMIAEGINKWSPFRDILASYKGDRNVVCVYQECDPYATTSAISIQADGTPAVCMRLFQDGKIYHRDDESTNMRGNLLSQTDCSGCEFWENCKGGCTGLAVDFDWRNKDRYCEMYRMLFRKYKNALQAVGWKKQEQCTTDKQSQKKQRKGPKSISLSGDKILGRKGTNEFSVRGKFDGIEYTDGSRHYIDSDNLPIPDLEKKIKGRGK